MPLGNKPLPGPMGTPDLYLHLASADHDNFKSLITNITCAYTQSQMHKHTEAHAHKHSQKSLNFQSLCQNAFGVTSGNVERRKIVDLKCVLQKGDTGDQSTIFGVPYIYIMTSSNGNIFSATGPWCGEFTGHKCISLTYASDAELWCFFDLHLDKRLIK